MRGEVARTISAPAFEVMRDNNLSERVRLRATYTVMRAALHLPPGSETEQFLAQLYSTLHPRRQQLTLLLSQYAKFSTAMRKRIYADHPFEVRRAIGRITVSSEKDKLVNELIDARADALPESIEELHDLIGMLSNPNAAELSVWEKLTQHTKPENSEHLWWLANNFPAGKLALDLLIPKLAQALQHPKIEIETSTKIWEILARRQADFEIFVDSAWRGLLDAAITNGEPPIVLEQLISVVRQQKTLCAQIWNLLDEYQQHVELPEVWRSSYIPNALQQIGALCNIQQEGMPMGS
jgi:hypothetical protein